MQALKWSGKPVEVLPAASADAQSDVLLPLSTIDSSFDFEQDASSAGLKRRPAMQSYLRRHTRAGQYVFQWMEDPAELPPLVLQQPAAAPVATGPPSDGPLPAGGTASEGAPDPVAVMQQHLVWAPAPVPLDRMSDAQRTLVSGDSEAKLYAPFQLVSGFEPDYSHAPLLTQQAAELSKYGAKHCGPKNLRTTVTCGDCGKPRGVYSQSAFRTLRTDLTKKGHPKSYLDEQLDLALYDDSTFTCGADPFQLEHPLSSIILTNTELQCSSPIERALYEALDAQQKWDGSRFSFNLCAACGTNEVPPERCEQLDCGESTGCFAEWKHLPLCAPCSDAGIALIAIDHSKGKKTQVAAKRAMTQLKRQAAAKKRKAAEADSDVEVSSDDDDVVISSDSEDDGGGAGPSVRRARSRRTCTLGSAAQRMMLDSEDEGTEG